MNKKQLIELLQEMAEKDLSEDANIYDHPCTVAVREINSLSDDVSHLRGIINGTKNKRSKRSMVLLGLAIDMSHC